MVPPVLPPLPRRDRALWLLALVPGGLAWLVFRPRNRFVRLARWLGVLGWLRTVIGFLIVVTVAFAVRDQKQERVLQDGVLKTLVAAGLAALSVLLVMAVFMRVTHPAAKGLTRRAMRRPVGTLAAYVLLLVAFAVGMYVSTVTGGTWYEWQIGPLAARVLGWTGTWVTVNWVVATLLVVRHAFNAVDGHPLMAPVLASWLAWLMGLLNLVVDGRDGLSTSAFVLINLGGPVTVTLLAAVEALWLRRTYGVTWRSGPVPSRWPVPPRPQPVARW